MRLDGYNPASALPIKPSRPAAPTADTVVSGAQAATPSTSVRTSAPAVQQPGAAGEYIPARQGATQPVHGHANQALASYQAMASLPDAEADGFFGVDLFV